MCWLITGVPGTGVSGTGVSGTGVPGTGVPGTGIPGTGGSRGLGGSLGPRDWGPGDYALKLI